MRCLFNLALALLALEVTLTVAPAFILLEQAVCPKASSSKEVPCIKTCLTDNNCLGNSKCCPSTCSRSCKTPTIGGTPPGPVTHGGSLAPICQGREEPPFSRIFLSKCWGDKKCCFSRCSMKRLAPVLGMCFLSP
uniref:WAP domain-containing protein n=1 Tax=Theropithecus gelada TaxID=9565 RepID=A0A8D2JZ22_THEGE